jgi:electron transfer flavoprotein alpha subunit/quercetin dioxygenase-like cupin family protein
MTNREIWIYGDLRAAHLWRNSLMVMAKAKGLARKTQAALTMILLGAKEGSEQSQSKEEAICMTLGAAADEALAYGVDKVRWIDHPHLKHPRSDVHVEILCRAVQNHHPWLVLFSLSDFGRETAAFCAQHCNAGMIADAVELELGDDKIVGRCPAWGGRILADITLAEGCSTAFVTVQPHGVKLEPCDSPRKAVEKHIPEHIRLPQQLKLKKRSLQSPEARRLEEAEVIVVGGAGLGDMRGFSMVRELAAALGGEVGATRPPVLQHWVEEGRLIGQTGKSVRPRLLISVGTSGAVQYTAGITQAETIVAINRDPKAPIFQWADLGIVADASNILPLLIQRAKKSAMRRLADAACTLTNEATKPPGGVGALVEQLRQARTWSREQLAEATGQTPDFIEQVETEQLAPPVSFILRMAQAMQVDPGTFLHKEEQATLRDMRAQAYYRRTQEYSYVTLTPDAQNSHLRAFMITIEPFHDHKPVAYKHEGEEFIFVMEGELKFTLGTKAYILKAGESIHFNSDVPHKLKNLSSEPTKCLVVVYTI